jgi:hypothetical protein
MTLQYILREKGKIVLQERTLSLLTFHNTKRLSYCYVMEKDVATKLSKSRHNEV